MEEKERKGGEEFKETRQRIPYRVRGYYEGVELLLSFGLGYSEEAQLLAASKDSIHTLRHLKGG